MLGLSAMQALIGYAVLPPSMMNGPNGPIFILKEGTERSQGRNAQLNNIAAARAVADAVRSTLGPKGMDKMLVDEGGDVTITNDGATILREIAIDHPAAKMIIEVAQTQEQECYDGTTSAVILAGELLKRSEELIDQNVHPTTICKGYRMAGKYIQKLLPNYELQDVPLINIATTALTGKSADSFKDNLATICVEVVELIADNGNVNLDNINIVKAVGGSGEDSRIIHGLVIDKDPVHSAMPLLLQETEYHTVAIINSALEVKQTEMDANIQITDPNQIEAFLAKEEAYLKGIVAKIIESKAQILICQREIDDMVKHYLAKAGIMALEKVKTSDIENLSIATGADIISNLDDLSYDSLGFCAEMEVKRVGEHNMTFFTNLHKDAVTLLLRGGTVHYVEEVERAFDDAVGVVSLAYKDGAVLTGGGSIHTALSLELDKYAKNITGREQMAIEAFAKALEVIPRTLAENAGLDPVDEMMHLRQAHSLKAGKHMGIEIENGGTWDMRMANVYEPKRVISQALKSAVETAIMVLRIDDVISSKKKGQ
jgi:archaeal chaperonin